MSVYIIGYTYKTEITCPECTVDRVTNSPVLTIPYDLPNDPEEALDIIADANAIDAQDEYSFDSNDFPKVILSVMEIEPDEICAECEGELIS